MGRFLSLNLVFFITSSISFILLMYIWTSKIASSTEAFDVMRDHKPEKAPKPIEFIVFSLFLIVPILNIITTFICVYLLTHEDVNNELLANFLKEIDEK